MKRLTTHRIILIWLLVAVFIFPYIVKSAHIFSTACQENVCQENVCQLHTCRTADKQKGIHEPGQIPEHESEQYPEDSPDGKTEHHPIHNCDDCIICQFNISFFTEAYSHNYLSVIREIGSIIYPVYQEDVYIPFFTANNLRAPPFC